MLVLPIQGRLSGGSIGRIASLSTSPGELSTEHFRVKRLTEVLDLVNETPAGSPCPSAATAIGEDEYEYHTDGIERGM